jgi:polyferredoxin
MTTGTRGASDVKRRKRTFSIARWSVLLLVLLVSTAIGLFHQKAKSLGLVGVDALCPFGGIESFWAFMTTGGLVIRRIAIGSFVLLGASVAVALIAGRAFCGQFCPLGTLQELMAGLRNRLGLKRRELPEALDGPARLLKYGVLIVFTWFTWRMAELVIRPFDPWVAYHHLTSPELLTEFGIGAAVLGISLVGSFVYDRFFCKYACPMGAFLAPISWLSAFKVRRDSSACIACGKCDMSCQMNLEIADRATPDSTECISCGVCVAECPVPGALTFSARPVTGKQIAALTPIALVGLSAAVMFGIVGVSMATGTMSVTNPTLAQQMREGSGELPGSGESEGHGAGAGEGAPIEPGTTDTSLIKGYMTLAEVAQAFGVPLAELQAQFGVNDADTAVALKDIKDAYGFDMEQLRAFVAERAAPQ